MTFSFISQAADIEVQWNCPQENYPGVPQLEQTQKVRVRLENGVVKFKPDPFKPKLLGDGFFRSINPLNKTKKALAVDYSECIKNFIADVSKKIPDYGPEWTAKIQRDIEAKPFFANSKDKKLLPRKWNYTKNYNLDYSGWREKIDEYCEGKESTYLGTEMLTFIGRNAAVVNSHPSQKCMDKIAKSIQESVEKDEAEYCELSEKICQNLKNLKKTVVTSIEENKGKRDKAMKEAEAKFGSIILQDKEAGFEEAFNGLMSKSPSDCAQYTGMIANSKDGSVGDIYKMHNLISKNRDALMNHMDGSCQKDFIRKYLDRNNANSLVGDWGIISYCKIN